MDSPVSDVRPSESLTVSFFGKDFEVLYAVRSRNIEVDVSWGDGDGCSCKTTRPHGGANPEKVARTIALEILTAAQDRGALELKSTRPSRPADRAR
jgi:hypothetical protein